MGDWTVIGARELSRDLAHAADAMKPEAARVVQQGALRIKQGMQRDANASRHFSGGGGKGAPLAASISYELADGGLAAEIGPVNAPGNTKTGGELANIAYIGTSRGGGTLDLTGPLNAEAPAILEHLQRIAEGR